MFDYVYENHSVHIYSPCNGGCCGDTRFSPCLQYASGIKCLEKNMEHLQGDRNVFWLSPVMVLVPAMWLQPASL